MNKMKVIVVVAAALLLLVNESAARRVPIRSRYSTAAPLAVEESLDQKSQINVEELEQKFSFPDPAAQNFKPKLESDRKSFGVSSGSNSPFSDLGSSSFGKGLRKKKPSYEISEEVEDDHAGETGSYEVNYKTTVTHKPGPSFDSGSFKFSSVTSAPKTKFGSSTKFSSFNHQIGSGSPSSGLFKFNEPAASSISSSSGSGQITTKFAINHPAPTHSAANLGGSYQTSFSDEGYGPTSGQLTEKFISDYHTALSKLKSEHSPKFDKPKYEAPKFDKPKYEAPKFDKPKFQSSPFNTKFTDGSNFKVSTDYKVGSETQFPNSHKLNAPTDFPSFKPNFRLQEVPNLYPSDDQFRPSVGYPGPGGNNGNKLFEPSSENEEFSQQQLAKNPASRGQYQQFLKSQQDEKIEQQALIEQLQHQHQQPKPKPPPKGLGRPPPVQGFSGASTKFRPYITVKKNFNRRKPLVRVASSPGLSHYRTPSIDGPYTLHFSV